MLPFEPGLTERVPFADSGAVGVGSFTPWSGGKGPSLPSTPATQGTPQPARPQPPATTPAYKPVAPAPPKPIPPPLVDDFPDEFICAHWYVNFLPNERLSVDAAGSPSACMRLTSTSSGASPRAGDDSHEDVKQVVAFHPDIQLHKM